MNDKTTNPQVYAPNIHLFAFHLRNSLKAGSGKVVDNAQLLWQKCDLIFNKLSINQQLDIYGYRKSVYKYEHEPSGNIVDLHPNTVLKFEDKTTLNSKDVIISGRAYPQRIYDSYALSFNIRRPETENGQKTDAVDLALLSNFNTDECILLPDFLESSLGQTIIITAGLTDEQKLEDANSLKLLADNCLEAFIPNTDKRPEYNRLDKLFSSYIFEYGRLIFDSNLLSQPPRYCHVIVWLFSTEETSEKFIECYQDFLDLYLYRNKIISTFQATREIHKELYHKYEVIEGEIKEINQALSSLPESGSLSQSNLQLLKEKLKKMPKLDLEYSHLLRNLEHDRNTITINTKNYLESLQEISSKLRANPKYSLYNDLRFLENFSKEECPYFQERIQADFNYFVQGSNLVDKAIASIRGMVEIEQAQRNRSLERTIQILGVGLGTGGIVASAISSHIETPITLTPTSNSNKLHPAVNTLFWSVAFLLLAAGVTWLSTKRN
ncbi:MAG: hypothetical protein F6K58_28880 [Symploca sp. SIO2E9]|nr:hypothetical protein [Symploca sp. SIO2E9]